jgi:NOL1/NOP2/fmu family ribosome biogenesis protein
MHVLNSKEKKQLLAALKEQFGFSGDLPALLQNQEGKVYATTADIGVIDHLRVDMVGLCIGSFEKDGFSLTIEGSQLVGPQADKNVVDLDKSQVAAWFRGEDLVGDAQIHAYVILRSGKDYLGSGKSSGEKIHNRVPKVRRLMVLQSVEE